MAMRGIDPTEAIIGVGIVTGQPVHTINANSRGVGDFIDVQLRLVDEKPPIFGFSAVHDYATAPGPGWGRRFQNSVLETSVQKVVRIFPEIGIHLNFAGRARIEDVASKLGDVEIAEHMKTLGTHVP